MSSAVLPISHAPATGLGAAWAVLKEWSQLLVVVSLSVLATAAGWYGVRVAESKWLERETRVAGERWAATLQSGLGDFEAVLRNGHVSATEQQFIDVASWSRAVIHYRIFNPRGEAVLSSERAGDRGAVRDRNLDARARRGRFRVQIIEDQDFGGGRRVLGEALVPVLSGGRRVGAVEVLVNMTDLAMDVREAADEILLPLMTLLLLAGIASSGFAAHSIRRRGREMADMEAARIRAVAAERAAARANNSKSEFLATMSHELRTPLNAIIGFSELMRTESFGALGSPRYIEFAHDIHASGTHLLEVINDILDLSKIEAGKFNLSEEKFDPASVIKGCIRLVQARADAGSVGLEIAVEDGLPSLWADKRKVKQVLLNLLTNAVKFTPADGSVTVSARLDGGIRFSVADTGIGIEPEDIPVIMAPFGQVENSRTRNFEGTGLGLPLARALMELHGGQLSIESQPGKGTTVTASFPSERISA